jgi:organic hydroperoxide reductase OsmC/OhrA
MLGTLNGALEVRGISLPAGDMSAEVEGINELRDGLVILTAVRVRYDLRIPPGTREAVDRALARHQEKCHTAQSLRGSVEVSWTAEIRETG